jgi:hypothetical protein
MVVHCNCKHEFVIEHIAGKMEPIRCKSVVIVQHHIREIKRNDPEGVKRGDYTVTEKSYFYEPTQGEAQ